MEAQSDCGNGPVTNMERVPIIEDQEIQRSNEKRPNGIENGEMQRRIKNIPVLEERRLLALERHIKRKRRRRPYVKKIRSFDKTEQELGKTTAAHNGKMPDDPWSFDLKDEVIQVSEGKGKDCSQKEIEGTRMAALNGLQTPSELSEDFEIPSTKMDAGKDKQQSVQFDILVEYLLDRVKSEILEKVENEVRSQSDVKQLNVEEEGQIKKDEGTCLEVKGEEDNVTHVKNKNSSPPEDASHVNDEDLKKEKENFKDEGHKHLERTKDTENKIVDIGDEKAEHSFNTSTESKEPTQNDPELEAVKTNQLIKHERENGKAGFDIIKKLVCDEDDVEEEDDDDGFMPRKLFLFSFSKFKKEESYA